MADRTALVSGGTGGLGSAVVDAFADAGWRVVVPDVAARAASREGVRWWPPTSPTRTTSPARSAWRWRSEGAPLRAVAHLVGGFADGQPVAETPLADFEAQFALNLRPAYLAVPGRAPRLAAAGGGAICCVSSRAALQPFAGAAGYCASKAALIAFARVVAGEGEPDGVRCNVVLPSAIATRAMLASTPPERHGTLVPPGRDRPRHPLPLQRGVRRDQRGRGAGLRRPRLSQRRRRGPQAPERPAHPLGRRPRDGLEDDVAAVRGDLRDVLDPGHVPSGWRPEVKGASGPHQAEVKALKWGRRMPDGDRPMTVERFLAQRATEREGVGAPISRRSRHTQRTLDAYLRAGGRPRWMERLSEIQGRIVMERRRLERHYRALQAECGSDRAEFARRWRRSPREHSFEPLNELIRQHNEWYPIERDLPMDPRTRDYVLIHGRSYRRARAGRGLGAPRVPGRRSTDGARRAPGAPMRGQAHPHGALQHRLRLHRRREPVAREAARAHAGGEGAQGLAGVRLRADPALRRAPPRASSSTPSRSDGRAGRAGHGSSSPPGRTAQLARTVSGAPAQVPSGAAADVAGARAVAVERHRGEPGRLVGRERGEGVDQVEGEVAEAADARAARVAHPGRRAAEPAVDGARMPEGGRGGREPADEPLAQHVAQPAQRGQLAQEEGRHGRGAAAPDLAGDRARLGGGPRDRLLDEQRAAGLGRLHAQRRPLVRRRADDDDRAAADRGLGAPDRRPGDRARDRGGVVVPRRREPQVRLGGDHAEHVGQVRVRAAQDGDVDRQLSPRRRTGSPCPPAAASRRSLPNAFQAIAKPGIRRPARWRTDRRPTIRARRRPRTSSRWSFEPT